MRILVVTAQTPFSHGGGEYHSINLVQNLQKHGHQVEEVKIPFKWYPPERILDQILSVRLLDVTESCGKPVDIIIGLKFPAYFIKHHKKVLWILHQHRPAYDLWETEFSDLSGKEGAAVREAIIKADNTYLREAKKIFTNSKNVSNRLKKYNSIDSVHLYHPPPHDEMLYSAEYENYIFYPSRLTSMKRQYLAIEAMKMVKGNIKLIIAGGSDSVSYEKSLKALIRKLNLDAKVKLLGMISDEEKINLYANSLAVLFIPYDEDYGYVTLEAFYSKKAVITCTDSGGPLEFVKDKSSGLVCSPVPESIAEAVDYLAANRNKSIVYGKEGYDFIHKLRLSWDTVVEALTQ